MASGHTLLSQFYPDPPPSPRAPDTRRLYGSRPVATNAAAHQAQKNYLANREFF